MTRKQAKRRKPQQARRVTLPSIPWRKFSALLLALATIALSYRFSAELLDQPISAITIEGSFQRVSALQIEEAISDELASGFLSADISVIQELVAALPWIDQANVVRRWPGSLDITVIEQVPAGKLVPVPTPPPPEPNPVSQTSAVELETSVWEASPRARRGSRAPGRTHRGSSPPSKRQWSQSRTQTPFQLGITLSGDPRIPLSSLVFAACSGPDGGGRGRGGPGERRKAEA